MFILDDLLLFPLKGVLWIGKKLDEAVQAELEENKVALQQKLSELYMQLSLGDITEEEFDEAEALVLDQMEAMERYKAEAEAEAEGDEDSEAETEEEDGAPPGQEGAG